MTVRNRIAAIRLMEREKRSSRAMEEMGVVVTLVEKTDMKPENVNSKE